MSVVQRNQTTNAGTTDSKGREPNTVDVDLDKILAMTTLGPKRALDATEDAWERSAPIKPGRYSIKAYLSKDKPKMGFYDEAKKEPWFTLSLECKVKSTDPEINDTTVFGGVTTRINRGKKISTAGGLVVKYGYKLPAEASDVDMVKLVTLVLKKEKPIDVEIDWKAGYKEADGTWINLANSYDDFPDNPEGGKDYELKITKKDGSKEDVRARLHITHWYGKDEASIKPGAGTVGTTGARPNGSVPVLADDETVPMGLVANRDKEPPRPAANAPANKPPVSDEDALNALLTES